MCLSTTFAALLGLSFAGCDAYQGLGPDPVSHTDAVEVSLPQGATAYAIKCPQSMASCLSRAQAICQGPFRVVAPAAHGPRVQALVDLQIRTVETDNSGALTAVCN
ncbi:MAG: hypothetical protein ACR652_08010 [Methylocystis sp.]|uniref:hypothetical protein n=1 Tax=Methylocystis sp. TaxID=1911079 RepID=UPI003DA5DCD3